MSAMGQVDSSTPDTSIAKMKFQNLKGGDLISTSYYAPPSQPREIGPGARSRTCWGAIFGGTFLYLAIMATFGSLGAAIFAGVGSSEGIKIWMTILAIISLYFAGHVAGRLSGAADRNVGMWNGLITFGMCFASVLVLGIALATASPYVVGAAGPRTARLNLVGVAAHGRWGLFIALFLGFIAAAIGGSRAIKAVTPAAVTPIPREKVA